MESQVKSAGSESGGAADLDEFPASVTPGGGMQLEAAVDDHLGSDQSTKAFRVELTELGPLGQVQHHLGAQQGLLDAGHLSEALARSESRLRVIDTYVRACRMQLICNCQRGGVPGVVRTRLERRPQYGDALPGHAATSLIDCQLGEFRPLAGVDRLH